VRPDGRDGEKLAPRRVRVEPNAARRSVMKPAVGFFPAAGLVLVGENGQRRLHGAASRTKMLPIVPNAATKRSSRQPR
jgi:hypothetical protein